jgi:hypothetical protein
MAEKSCQHGQNFPSLRLQPLKPTWTPLMFACRNAARMQQDGRTPPQPTRLLGLLVLQVSMPRPGPLASSDRVPLWHWRPACQRAPRLGGARPSRPSKWPPRAGVHRCPAFKPGWPRGLGARSNGRIATTPAPMPSSERSGARCQSRVAWGSCASTRLLPVELLIVLLRPTSLGARPTQEA